MPDNYDGYLWKLDEAKRICESLPGKPLLLEHNENDKIGKILSANVSESGYVRIMAEIDGSTPLGRQTIDNIKNKKYKGFSCGQNSCEYLRPDKLWGVKDKDVFEVSVVSVPNVKSALIEFFETDNPEYYAATKGQDKVVTFNQPKKMDDSFMGRNVLKNQVYKPPSGLKTTIPQIPKMSQVTQPPAQQPAQTPVQNQNPPQPAAQVDNTNAPQSTEHLFNTENTEQNTADALKLLQEMIASGAVSPEKIALYAQRGIQEDKKNGEEARGMLSTLYNTAFPTEVPQAMKPLADWIKNAPTQEMEGVAPIAFVATTATAGLKAENTQLKTRLSDKEKEIEMKNQEIQQLKAALDDTHRRSKNRYDIGNLFGKNYTTTTQASSQPQQQVQQPAPQVPSYAPPVNIPPSLRILHTGIPRSVPFQVQNVPLPQTPTQIPVSTTASASSQAPVASSHEVSTVTTTTASSMSSVYEPYIIPSNPEDVNTIGVAPNPNYYKRKFGAMFEDMLRPSGNLEEQNRLMYEEKKRRGFGA